MSLSVFPFREVFALDKDTILSLGLNSCTRVMPTISKPMKVAQKVTKVLDFQVEAV